MEDIICPQCNNIVKPKDDWDFMDGEKHKISCSCGKQFVVIIDRPIEYYVLGAQAGAEIIDNVDLI